jgi:uncharacterized protein YndB with AHSA1/START domain
MKLRDRTHIDAPPERVWEILADPSLMELWNPKCVRCEANDSRAHVGLRFQATFRLNGPEQPMECEVTDCASPELITFRYTGETLRAGGYVEETFDLRPAGEGTRIGHAVDLSRSGLPWIVRALAKLLSAVGRQASESSLDCIEELAEEPR